MAKKDEKKKTKKAKTIEMPRRNSAVVYVVLVVAIIISVVAAEFFTTRNVNDLVLAQLNYFEQGNVDYKVYYVKNPDYDKVADLSLPIMAQYVDKISASFNYYTNYSEKITGNYTYKITAHAEAYNPSDPNEVYWYSEYKNLTPSENVGFKSQNNYRILKNVEIKYTDFLNKYLDWKKNKPFASRANLYITLEVVNDGVYEGLDSIKHDANMKLVVPLSEPTFYIKTESSIKPDEQKIVKVENNDAEKVFGMIIAGLLWLSAVFFGGALLVVYRVNAAKESVYARKLKKILNTYDSIIVNVEKLPKLSDLSVVNVTTFEELVDAQMEVRLPINFKEDEKNHVSKFVLVRNNLAWVYTLEEGNSSEK